MHAEQRFYVAKSVSRYFLQGPVILKKFPFYYPVTDQAMDRIQKVLSDVLDKPVNFQKET